MPGCEVGRDWCHELAQICTQVKPGQSANHAEIHTLPPFTRHTTPTHSIKPHGKLVAYSSRLLWSRHGALALAPQCGSRQPALVLHRLDVGAVSLLRAGRVCQLRDVFSRAVGGLRVSEGDMHLKLPSSPGLALRARLRARLGSTHSLRLRPSAEVIRRNRVQRRMGCFGGTHVGGSL